MFIVKNKKKIADYNDFNSNFSLVVVKILPWLYYNSYTKTEHASLSYLLNNNTPVPSFLLTQNLSPKEHP